MYISNSDTRPTDNDYSTIKSTGDQTNGTSSVTLYLWAKPSPGYTGTKWVIGNKEVNVESGHSITLDLTGHTSSSNPLFITYQAIFTKQDGVVQAMVAEGQDSRGSVSINFPTS